MTTDTEYISRVRRYCEENALDYRFFWMTPRHRCMHFGYWDAGTRRHGESLVRMDELMTERARIGPGMRVLDAGCGVGGCATWLARTVAPQVFGVTLVPGEAAKASRRARKLGVKHLAQFFVQDFMSLGFKDEMFDVVWAHESICYAPDKAQFLREAFRVLRPGGRLIVEDGFLRASGSLLGDEDKAALSTWLDGWALKDVAAVDDFVRWAKMATFADVEFEDITEFARPSLARLHKLSRRNIWLSRLLNRLRLRSDVQHGNVVSSLVQKQLVDRGVTVCGMMYARKPNL